MTTLPHDVRRRQVTFLPLPARVVFLSLLVVLSLVLDSSYPTTLSFFAHASPSTSWTSTRITTTTTTEREILLQFFQATEGHQWFRSDSWGSPQVSICQWWGITCSGGGGSSSGSVEEGGQDHGEVVDGAILLLEEGVTEVRMPKNNVAHSIATLFQLPHLRLVDLKQNPIDHAGLLVVDQQQQQQRNTSSSTTLVLEALDLSDCLLTSIPTDILLGASETLRQVRLARNSFRNAFFPNLMTDLQVQVGRLPRLEILDLSYNSIRGPLELFPTTTNAAAANDNASSIIAWKDSLVELNLQENQLSGTIPTTIAYLTQLQVLNLARNRLTGILPAPALNSLTSLTTLNLQAQQSGDTSDEEDGDDGDGGGESGYGGSQLYGELADLSLASRLTTLILSHNQFSGSIPDTLLAAYQPPPSAQDEDGSSTSSIFDLDDPAASSQQEDTTTNSSSPSFLLSELVTVDVSFNFLTGVVPESLVERFGNNKASLHLNIVGNFLEGPLPNSFCNQSQWMQGQVGIIGCDAIACPPGYYNSRVGKATASSSGGSTSSSNSCRICPNSTASTSSSSSSSSSASSKMYIGATKCLGQEDPLPLEPVILAELYKATGGPDSWTKRQGWEELVTAVDSFLLLQQRQQDPEQQVVISTRNTTSSVTSDIVPTSVLCALQGIICNEQGQVTMITLSNNGLVGTIPYSLFQLLHLVSLDLSDNLVEINDDDDEDGHGGGLTSLMYAHSLTRLKLANTRINSKSLRHISLVASTLTELALNGNNLNGPLPTEILRLRNLVDLRLEVCFLTGTIPLEIGTLTNLKRLHLNENQLTGNLPVGLAQLSALEELDLSNNMLGGTLPTEWNNGMSRLLTLRINSNNNGDNNGNRTLGGPLIAFSGLQRIEVLELSKNAFYGTLPSDFLSGRSRDGSLRIDLSGNQLSGSLPSGLADLSRLFLAVEDNNITGIPAELCQDDDWMDGEVGKVPNRCDAILCPPGTWSVLGRASVENEAMCTVCPSAAYFGATTCDSGEIQHNPEADILDQLYLSTGGPWWKKPHYNWTKPSIPICYREGVRCMGTDPNSGVVEVYLNEFGLRGKIPDEIFDLPVVRLLGFSFNHVDLSLQNIGNAAKLQSLLISATNVKSLEGIENAGDNFVELHMAKNGIQGSFPSELIYLTSLRSLFLSENRLSGTIPTEIGVHMKGLRQLVLFSNRFVGFVPSELGQLPELSQLHLHDNLLSGLIPSSFQNLQNLEDINLSGQNSIKKFTGPLFSFESNAALRRVDLSGNAFAGTVPLTFLKAVDRGAGIFANLSRNELHGAVPDSLAEFLNLEIDLASNMISFIPQALCGNSDWMNGMVGNVHPDEACNAILCPPGTYSSSGRQTRANAPCKECEDKNDAPYYGSLNCKGVVASAPCTYEVVDGNAICSDSTTERSTLELLFASTWGGGWKNKTLWMTDQPICSWDGVICEGEKESDEGVLALELANNGLSGSLPSQIWSLPKLKRVALQENRDLSVTLQDLPERSQLETLLLHGSSVDSLEGVARAVSLREISVSGLSGSFPADLFKLRNLEQLHLDDNVLVGTLPVDFVFLQRLKVFSAKGNDFHGSLPAALVRLTGLEELVLDENLLSGTLPANELESASSLRVLSIARERKSGRKLSGPLPSLSNSPSLESISLQGNEFSGTIPVSFATASSRLQRIDLRDNLLTGSVPEELEKHTGLSLFLASNRFSSLPQGFCVNEEWMSSATREVDSCSAVLCPPGTWSSTGRAMNSSMTCSQCPPDKKTPFFGSTSCDSAAIDERSILLELFATCGGSNWYRRDFWGTPTPVCEWFGIGCSNGSIILINLQENNLKCRIPMSLFKIPQLEKLNLASNNVDLNFKAIASAQKLSELRLSMTKVSSLTGIGSAPSLTVLDLSSSNLTGTIPDAIFTLSNLRVLSLRDNHISGEIPLQSWGKQLRYLRILRLDNNRLTGSVPSFADSETLRHIFLGGNALNGTIPVDFLQRASLDESLTIDISRNKIVGSIPQDLARFKVVKLLVAGNQIDSLPSLLCSNAKWNDGDVKRFGCDGIVCPPRTRSSVGRRTSEVICEPCTSGGSLATSSEFYGQLSCPNEEGVLASSSANRPTRIFGFMVSAFPLSLLLLCVFGML